MRRTLISVVLLVIASVGCSEISSPERRRASDNGQREVAQAQQQQQTAVASGVKVEALDRAQQTGDKQYSQQAASPQSSAVAESSRASRNARSSAEEVLPAGASASEAADDEPTWLSSGRLSLSGRVLEENEEYAAGMMLPLGVYDKGALFCDLRGSFLEDLGQEVNAGLVARKHLEGLGVILGANAYYDGRWTDNDNRFDQVAGGIEVLSAWVDFRVNYYYPLTDAVVLEEASDTTPGSVGSQSVQTTTTYKSYEEALDGVDAEIGVWLPWVSRFVPVAVYGGYYQFHSDLIDDDEFGGAKARVEARLHPNVTLSGEWFAEKALNQSEYIASIEFRVPLGFWRGAKLPKAGGPYNPLASRLMDEVQRDLRVRVIETGPVEYSKATVENKPEQRTSKSESGPQTQPQTQPQPSPVQCHDVLVVDPITGTITVQTVCN